MSIEGLQRQKWLCNDWKLWNARNPNRSAIYKLCRKKKANNAINPPVITETHRDLRTPFGGMKNSGVGREGGWEALKFFTEAKNVCVQF